MSKFKVGDKVLIPLGVGVVYGEEEFNLDLDEWYIKVVIGERFGFNRVITFETNDLELYKTPHQELLDLGWELSKVDDRYIEYINEEGDYLIINKIEKTYYKLSSYYRPFDFNLELAKILVRYLEELEWQKIYYLMNIED